MGGPDTFWNVPLTANAPGSGRLPNTFTCVWAEKGVTILQIGLPLMVVALKGPVNRMGAPGEPAAQPALAWAALFATVTPGELTVKHWSFTMRPVSRPPPSCTPDPRRGFTPALK